jgi:predicted aminopeptidase
MDLLKRFSFAVFLFSLSGCYYVKQGYSQLSLLSSRIPVEEALQDPTLSEEEKRKLRLAQDVRVFAEEKLGLKPTGNYTSFVKLDRPYVTYVVSAAPKWELRHHRWWFPIVGSVPYKGFFSEKDAKEEEADLREEGLDTYLRGVSAFSTLGWFRDPILSSMLRYRDEDLVNTLIHETVHATLYIKSNADFNERLAVFMGNWGTELFYREKEGPASKTVAEQKLENDDEKLFAEFISKELSLLEGWYKDVKESERNEEARQARLKEIQSRFESELRPRMKTKAYESFPKQQLNNARLLIYKTYLQDLSAFEKLAAKLNWDFRRFLDEVKTLEKHPEPEKGLKEKSEPG